MDKITIQSRIFEISAAIITGLGKILFVDILEYKLEYTITACLFWIAYILIRFQKNRNVLRYWGFTKKNFSESFKKLFPYAILSAILFFLYGYYFGNLILEWHGLLILLIYPIWGVIQQFLVVGLVAGNLTDQNKIRISRLGVIILTSILFSIVHYPSVMLMIGTLILAVVYVIEYLEERNLWVLGIYHGWLGCAFYYFVLNRDPFIEMFSKIL